MLLIEFCRQLETLKGPCDLPTDCHKQINKYPGNEDKIAVINLQSELKISRPVAFK